MNLFLLLAAGAVFIVWTMTLFNNLVGLRHDVRNALRQLGTLLVRRHDLLPPLLAALKEPMEFDQQPLIEVAQAREHARLAAAAGSLADRGATEDRLTLSLGRLFAAMENHPRALTDLTVVKLREELTTVDNQIAFSRQLYNDLVRRYNAAQETFPASLVCRPLRHHTADYMEIGGPETGTAVVPLCRRPWVNAPAPCRLT